MRTLKKSLLLLFVTLTLAVIFCFGASAAIESSGKCGENVYWNYNESTGELVISGKGSMYDYDYKDSPFYCSSYFYIYNLQKITIKSGVTSIGDYVFCRSEKLTSVIIPDTVTSINEAAFSNCISLKSIVLPNSITEIEEGAFSGCDSLLNIVIPDSVTSLGAEAFYSCDSLQSITLGDGILCIDKETFYECDSLSNVFFGKNITEIGEYAFYECYSLEKIVIPDSVKRISKYSFFCCGKLSSISLPDGVYIEFYSFYGTAYYADESNWVDGALYIGKYLICGKDDISDSCKIKDGTSVICERAFINCDFTEIIIPDSVVSIEQMAFHQCNNLKSIVIPDSISEIKYETFYHCDALELVTLPETVKSIAAEAFYWCGNLKFINIPEGVEAIKDDTFYNCMALESIVVPVSVVTVEYGAFHNCYGLKEVYYGGSQSQWQNIVIENDNNKLLTSDVNFNSCLHKNLKDFSQVDSTCVNVGYSAGKYCLDCNKWILGHKELPLLSHSYTSEITMSPTHFAQGTKTFTCSCGDSYSETIEKLPHTDSDSDSWCDICDEYCISELVKTGQCGENVIYKWYEDGTVVISGTGAMTDYDNSNSPFYDSDIKSVVIKDGVTTIGYGMFCFCGGLQGVIIPDSVTTIGDWVFGFCTSLQSVTIPDSVATIGDAAFNSCKSLQRVTISDSVTTIGGSVFWDCDSLQNVTIGNSVTTIGYGAFYSCTSLQSITIPDSVTSIGDYTFSNCDSLKGVYYKGTKEQWKKISIGSYNSSLTGATIHYHYNNNHNEIDMDAVGSTCTEIGYTAGKYCPDCEIWLEGHEEIPAINHKNATQHAQQNATCTEIGYTAGKYCSDCKTWTEGHEEIPAIAHTDSNSDSWCDICDEYCLSKVRSTGFCGERVTYKWYEDGTVVISGTGAMTDYIGGSPFFGSDVKSVVIKDGVTTIGNYAFPDCVSLISLVIPDSVTTIGNVSFCNCDSLTSITIGNSVTSIGEFAFKSCNKLISVTIPDSVTSIDRYAFSDCPNLQSVTIPDSVTTIGDCAFSHCDSLLDVYYKGTKEQWKNTLIGTYNNNLTDATIHYHYNNNHTEIDKDAVEPTCTEIGYTAGKYCPDCETWLEGHNEIPAISHTYKPVLTKATFTANGKIESKCSCGKVQKTETIAKVSSLTLSTTKYIYDGKNKTPKLTVKDSNGKTLVKNTDYKITVASKRAGIGRYTVKVTLVGNYSGTKNLYFYILPGKSASVKSASQTVSSVKLSWSAVPGAAGYTIYRYSSSKKVYVKEGTTEGTTFTVKSLYAGKKYTFRVVAYGKTAAGKVYNSETYALLKTATKTKTPVMSDAVAYKGKVKLFWTATTGETGYTVYYSTSKTSGFKKYKNYESNSGYVNNLTSGKTYYFKVRTYIKTDSGYVYSAWSNIKGVKVK